MIMEGSPTSTERNTISSHPRQAACLACRRSKTRCLRSPGDARCAKCQQSNSECVLPENFHVGRQKGTKNKRTGLNKALHRIEQAIQKSTANGGVIENEQTAMELQNLLNKTQSLLPGNSISSDLMAAVQMRSPSRAKSQAPPLPDHYTPGSSNTNFSSHAVTDDSFALDDAENPLQLLAHASELPNTSPQPSMSAASQPLASTPARPGLYRVKSNDQDLRTFFGPFTPNLDVGEDIDPIDMGYITQNETDVLFSFFYQNLSHTRWGLDPVVHTAKFVRSRSAFLFTSILAASALFLPSTAALSKRLSVHCKNLANSVMAKGWRSPEIVLAFMVNIPWMAPGKHRADDPTCSYMAMALTVAIDLSLNKLIVPSPTDPQGTAPDHIAKSECIAAKKALQLDGFGDVDPLSTWGRRLLRRRERIWLSLFVLDRGVCLARGRSFTVPITTLIEACDGWHVSDIADTWDGSIISSAVLRRDLERLIIEIRATCDSEQSRESDGTTLVQTLQSMIDGFFDRWYATWAFSIEGSRQHHLPPYVEILVTHTRLSTYGSVINHPTAPLEVKRFFHAAGPSSSLNVMRAAVQGEGKLKSMPNNTAIMVSFAACFALILSTMAAGNTLSLAPSIKILIEETADVLERIGSTPSHRNSLSALYGRHLREVVRNSQSRQIQHKAGPVALQQDTPNNLNSAANNANPNDTSGMMSFEPLLFSAMSDHQVIEAINNAGDELGTLPGAFQMDESMGLGMGMSMGMGSGAGTDWLDWFSLDYNNTV